jgi:hypothetical protein
MTLGKANVGIGLLVVEVVEDVVISILQIAVRWKGRQLFETQATETVLMQCKVNSNRSMFDALGPR